MLYDRYSRLCRNIPQDDVELFGLPLRQGSPIWMSIDFNAYPALLLPAQLGDRHPDIILRSIDVLFSRTCEIKTARDQHHSECYSIIRLKENDPDIVRLFTKIVEERFCRGEAPKNNAEIAENVQEVAALFSSVSDTPRDLIGLWGELYLITRADDLMSAIRSWSARKTAKYDFVTERFVLDVKTTLSSSPKHRFSLEQLRPHGTYDAYILSLCVVEVQAGQTVGALMDGISAQIGDAELRNAFLRQCLVKGGKDIYRSDLTLQAYPDGDALMLYNARDIPVPNVERDDPIENVRFDVDLTAIAALDIATCGVILCFGP